MKKDFSQYINFSKGKIIFFRWRNEDNWPVEYVTPSIKNILGYDVEDFISGKTVYSDIIHKDDIERIEQELILATNNNEDELTHELYRIKDAEGVYKYVYDHTSIIRDENGNISHYEGYIIDQTNIILQKERLELVLEGTQLGLWDWNPQTNDVVFDERWANMLGYELHEIESTLDSWQSRVHPSDLNDCFKDITAHMEGKTELYNNIHRMMHKDGKWRYILDRGKIVQRDDNGNPIRFTGTHTDITKLKEIELKLQQKQQKLKKYLDIIEDNVIMSSTDLKGNITYASEAFCKISGYSKDELIGKNYRLVKHKDMPRDLYTNLWETIINNDTWTGEIKNRRKDGSYYWVKTSISPIFDENHNKIGYTSIREDISDKKIIEELSITDGLTNIYNRRYFDEISPKFVNTAKRKNEIVCFLILDIDHFKQYNDTYGHQMGDEVLINVAKVIKKELKRADDYCFRLGGEEFGILFKIENTDLAFSFADSFRISIENLQIKHRRNSASEYITASMGLVCEYANDIESIHEIYKKADERLYKSKESGRNKVTF